MRFLIDGCIGRSLTEWLRNAGHDALEAEDLRPDPGDESLLRTAEAQNRIVITIDKDFGELIYRDRQPHAGLIRLPDVSPFQRIELVDEIISRYHQDLENRAIVTVRGESIRISHPPTN